MSSLPTTTRIPRTQLSKQLKHPHKQMGLSGNSMVACLLLMTLATLLASGRP